MTISLVTKCVLIPKNTKIAVNAKNASKKQRYKTALVFDIDGVIVRNKILLSNVGANCSNFIRLIDKNNLTEAEADTYNNKLYKDYGHSLKGWLHENNKYDIISHRRYIDNNFMRQLFNRYVYDDVLLNDLRSYLFTDMFTKNEDYTYLSLIHVTVCSIFISERGRVRPTCGREEGHLQLTQ